MRDRLERLRRGERRLGRRGFPLRLLLLELVPSRCCFLRGGGGPGLGPRSGGRLRFRLLIERRFARGGSRLLVRQLDPTFGGLPGHRRGSGRRLLNRHHRLGVRQHFALGIRRRRRRGRDLLGHLASGERTLAGRDDLDFHLGLRRRLRRRSDLPQPVEERIVDRLLIRRRGRVGGEGRLLHRGQHARGGRSLVRHRGRGPRERQFGRALGCGRPGGRGGRLIRDRGSRGGLHQVRERIGLVRPRTKTRLALFRLGDRRLRQVRGLRLAQERQFRSIHRRLLLRRLFRRFGRRCLGNLRRLCCWGRRLFRGLLRGRCPGIHRFRRLDRRLGLGIERREASLGRGGGFGAGRAGGAPQAGERIRHRLGGRHSPFGGERPDRRQCVGCIPGGVGGLWLARSRRRGRDRLGIGNRAGTGGGIRAGGRGGCGVWGGRRSRQSRRQFLGLRGLRELRLFRLGCVGRFGLGEIRGRGFGLRYRGRRFELRGLGSGRGGRVARRCLRFRRRGRGFRRGLGRRLGRGPAVARGDLERGQRLARPDWGILPLGGLIRERDHRGGRRRHVLGERRRLGLRDGIPVDCGLELRVPGDRAGGHIR
jgi:hypothetical protein